MLRLLRRKKRNIPITPPEVDFHSHFLPGLDDGCSNLEESISLIKQMKELGYTKLIMSPHVMGDFYRNTREGILQKLDILRTEVKNRGIDMVLEATAEYYLDEWLDEKIKNHDLLPFGNQRILFEISYVNEPRNLFDTIFHLKVAGYRPILAHPERYNYLHHDLSVYEKLVEAGCELQLNMLSLIGYYGKGAKIVADQLIQRNLVHYICSDAHRQNHVTLLKEALQSPLYQKALPSLRHHQI